MCGYCASEPGESRSMRRGLRRLPPLSSDRSMDPLNDRLLDPPHQPLEGLVRWVCDEPASLTPESVLTGTKERREKLLSSFRANGGSLTSSPA